MATYIAYDDLVLNKTPLAYWRLTDAQAMPMPDATGNGHDMTTLGGGAFSTIPMFSYAPQSHGLRADNNLNPSITNEAGIYTAIDTSQAFTVIAWMHPDPSSIASDMYAMHTTFSDGGQHYMRWGNFGNDLYWVDDTYTAISRPQSGQANMVVVMSDATDDHLWINGNFAYSAARTASGWPGLANFTLGHSDNQEPIDFAWVAIYDRLLTNDELTEMYNRRLFQGQISGTLTLDGSPTADATVRSFRRSDGQINGEATSAGDGTYDLTVLDNVECDLIAIPPAGVAARPLAHGPIIPLPYTQT